MNDPHVQALLYRVVQDGRPYYEDTRPLEHDTAQFRVNVDKLIARFEMKDHFATVEEARHKVEEFIAEWELQADANPKLGPGEFRLVFESAEMIDRNPTQLSGQAANFTITPSDGGVLFGRGTYPEPPKSWPQTIVMGQAEERDEALPITPAPPASGGMGYGAQQLPSITQEAHGVGSRPTPPELDAAKQAALDALEALKQAITEEKDLPTSDQQETPGIGHNKPPEPVIELDEIADVGIEAVTEPKPEIGPVRTVRAALSYHANRFAENFSAEAGKSTGKYVGPVIVAALLHAIGALDKLIELLKAFPG